MPDERGPGPRFEEIRPEPGRFWVRWAPRGWRGPAAPFLDLARGRLAPGALRRGDPPAAPPATPHDTVYLPPVGDEGAALRAGWLDRARAAGHAVLAQVIAGDGERPAAGLVVADLTAALLAGEPRRLERIPPGAAAAWPLLAGLTDDPALVRDGCARLRAAGVAAVQAVVPELTPSERRSLAESATDDVYHALFHAAPPSVGEFARIAVAQGLSPFLPRPPLPVSGRRARNRALAEHLAVVAEWWLLLGRPEGGAQALFRAARWVDGEDRDVVAVAAEGNLAVVDWLEAGCRAEIERFAAGRGEAARAALTAELLRG